MAAFTDIAEADFLDLFFTNAAWLLVGDAGGLRDSATAGDLFASLHTGDNIGDTSTIQTDNEGTYTGYARDAIARSTSGWSVSGTSPTIVDNDNLLQFGEMTAGGPVTITDVALGELVSTGGAMWIHGQVTPPDLVINDGVNPQFIAAALSVAIA